jgi:hypothetical protein
VLKWQLTSIAIIIMANASLEIANILNKISKKISKKAQPNSFSG